MSGENRLSEFPDREYFQMMNLAEMLGYKSKCECCQRLIENHSFLELQVCLQELSKRDAKNTEITLHNSGSVKSNV